MIFKSFEIDIKNFNFKKRISIGKNLYYIPLKYLNDTCFIQTPILFIPFSKSKYNQLDVSLWNIDTDTEMSKFYSLISELSKLVARKYNKYKFVNPIKPKVLIFPERLKLNIANEKFIKLYNEHNIEIAFNTIQPKTYAKFIICPNNIWINNDKIGITWNIIQIKTYLDTKINYLEKECMFIDEEETQDYSKYFNMLKRGVPKEAIKQKLKLDNLDPSIIDNNRANNRSNINKFNPLSNLLSDIKNGPKLKKRSPIQHDKKITKSNSFAPSLHDIRKALSKFNKK